MSKSESEARTETKARIEAKTAIATMAQKRKHRDEKAETETKTHTQRQRDKDTHRETASKESDKQIERVMQSDRSAVGADSARHAEASILVWGRYSNSLSSTQ